MTVILLTMTTPSQESQAAMMRPGLADGMKINDYGVDAVQAKPYAELMPLLMAHKSHRAHAAFAHPE